MLRVQLPFLLKPHQDGLVLCLLHHGLIGPGGLFLTHFGISRNRHEAEMSTTEPRIISYHFSIRVYFESLLNHSPTIHFSIPSRHVLANMKLLSKWLACCDFGSCESAFA